MRISYCPSDYRLGDERNSRSPWYEEPPEGMFYEPEHAVDWLMDVEENMTKDEAWDLVEEDLVEDDNGLYSFCTYPY